MKKYIVALCCLTAFFGALAVLTAVAEQDAAGIRDGVFRFHVVASSDSDTDQQLKLAVRDGLTELCSSLFGSAPDKAAAMAIAEDNADVIKAAAEDILRGQGNADGVEVCVTQRFFPTRSYDGVSLPAGVYDTLDVRIGAAAGKNFWCVLFPDICVGASAERSPRDKLSDVLEGGSYDMATDKSTPSVRFKFKAVEIFETVKNFLFSKK